MRRILVTGKNGQIGWELQRTLATLGEIVACDRAELDLCDPDAIRRVVRRVEPYLIVNAAAYTAVDRAEADEGTAMAANGVAPGILAEEAARLNAGFVHYSTDYVFDGRKDSAYDEQDPPNPLNVYGRTKLAGETAIRQSRVSYLILRTSWVYGSRGNNFLRTIVRLSGERDELRVVHDQIGAPTWSRMIAEATAQMLSRCLSGRGVDFDRYMGIYHMTAAGAVSWCEFATAILERRAPGAGQQITVVPVRSEEYQTAAVRPRNSLLSNEKLVQTFGITLPDWKLGLRLCMQD